MTGAPLKVRGFSRLAPHEQAVLALSAVAAGFLVVDPLVLSAVRALDPGVRGFFRAVTDIGKSGWILIPSGAAVIVLAALRARGRGLRLRAAYGCLAQLLGFLFVSVAVSGLAASLIKNVLGRARPKLFDEAGPLAFQPFTFDADYAAFPSGHATTVFALAGVLTILWPRARVVILTLAAWGAASRFLIGAHYISDVAAGAALGLSFPYFLRRRLADRRWVFEKGPGGAIRLRGKRVMRWAVKAATAWLPYWSGPALRAPRT